MPIESPELPRLGSDDMRAIDYEVMRHAFASQNELGRLCDEGVYQADVAARLRAAGIEARHEVPLRVWHGTFEKIYRLDLIAAESFVYEFKTVAALVGEHDAQLLNYLLLTNTAHGKLINFRPSKVAARFVNAPVDDKRRREIRFVADRFTDDAASLRALLLDLLADWGMFLDLALYTQALTHFLGGEDQVIRMIPMARGEIPLGNQRMHLLSDSSAFRLTGFKTDLSAQEHHIRRMLSLTSLESIHWINLCREEVSLVTVR
jgi:GxxExxY protein